jgi:site-specific DNA-adenine methylase
MKRSPLPFQGQKTNFLKQFNEALNAFDPNGTYVDLFGGSGLLSHTLKLKYPNARVIWNDHDNFAARLAMIPETNELVENIAIELDVNKKARLTPEQCAGVRRVIAKHRLIYGDVDHITMSSNILFSGGQSIDFEKNNMYNCARNTAYNSAGYLQGVERVSCDYKDLANAFPNAIMVCDPPYLTTDVAQYAMYWGLVRALEVLKVLKKDYFYFTSDKSELPQLCEFMQENFNAANPFSGAKKETRKGVVSAKAIGYEDQMFYKTSYLL